MKNERDDTFLARWLNGELSPEELREFEKSEEFGFYRKIARASSQIQPEEFDTEALLAKIKDRSAKETRPASATKIIKLWPYGIAAAIALLAAFFIFHNPATIIKTGYGRQQAVTFSDGSSATVNANSMITYKEENWSESRTIELDGEAYFQVEKGPKFSVVTELGEVTVLGTAFNVRISEGFFQVTCYEGKVSVEVGDTENILDPGDHFRWINGSVSTSTRKAHEPAWMRGQSSFEAVPVLYVLDALSDQYNLAFTYDSLDSNRLYTGSFPHDNKELALRIVLGALEIDYSVEDDHTVTLKK